MKFLSFYSYSFFNIIYMYMKKINLVKSWFSVKMCVYKFLFICFYWLLRKVLGIYVFYPPKYQLDIIRYQKPSLKFKSMQFYYPKS